MPLLPAASNRLFVGNLSYNTTAEGLGKHFAQLDGFKAANVAFDPRRQASRGFGFVEFESVEAAQRAKEVGGAISSVAAAAQPACGRCHEQQLWRLMASAFSVPCQVHPCMPFILLPCMAATRGRLCYWRCVSAIAQLCLQC
jgi:hypothetical protein